MQPCDVSTDRKRPPAAARGPGPPSPRTGRRLSSPNSRCELFQSPQLKCCYFKDWDACDRACCLDADREITCQHTACVTPKIACNSATACSVHVSNSFRGVRSPCRSQCATWPKNHGISDGGIDIGGALQGLCLPVLCCSITPVTGSHHRRVSMGVAAALTVHSTACMLHSKDEQSWISAARVAVTTMQVWRQHLCILRRSKAVRSVAMTMHIQHAHPTPV